MHCWQTRAIQGNDFDALQSIHDQCVRPAEQVALEPPYWDLVIPVSLHFLDLIFQKDTAEAIAHCDDLHALDADAARVLKGVIQASTFISEYMSMHLPKHYCDLPPGHYTRICRGLFPIAIALDAIIVGRADIGLPWMEPRLVMAWAIDTYAVILRTPSARNDLRGSTDLVRACVQLWFHVAQSYPIEPELIDGVYGAIDSALGYEDAMRDMFVEELRQQGFGPFSRAGMYMLVNFWQPNSLSPLPIPLSLTPHVLCQILRASSSLKHAFIAHGFLPYLCRLLKKIARRQYTVIDSNAIAPRPVTPEYTLSWWIQGIIDNIAALVFVSPVAMYEALDEGLLQSTLRVLDLLKGSGVVPDGLAHALALIQRILLVSCLPSLSPVVGKVLREVESMMCQGKIKDEYGRVYDELKSSHSRYIDPEVRDTIVRCSNSQVGTSNHQVRVD